jgi:hypothetical protein
MAGVSEYAFTTFLSGKYQGNVLDIQKRIEATLEREIQRKQMPREECHFVATSTSSRIFELCALSRLQRDIGIAYGEPGCGKTEAVREFARRTPDSVLVECHVGFSALTLFGQWNHALGYASHGKLRDVFDSVVEKMKGSGRLAILDEAEHVDYRGLEMARRVHDFCGIGIVMTGLPVLLQNLRGRRGEYKQLFSRVGMAVKIENITQDDARKLVESWMPESGDLWTSFWRECQSNARRLNKLVKMARHIAKINRMVIDDAIIRRASELLIS